jgi:hypothetical protein
MLMLAAIIFGAAGLFIFAKYDLYDASTMKWRRAAEPTVAYAYAAVHFFAILAGICLFLRA